MSHLLLISSHFPPDLSAGAFRMGALVESLQVNSRSIKKITVLTSTPTRFQIANVKNTDERYLSKVRVFRVKMLQTRGKKFIEILNFLYFSLYVFLFCILTRADIVFCTTSKFFTSFVSAISCRLSGKKLILDVRDLFSDTVQSLYQIDENSKIIKILNYFEKYTYDTSVGVIIVSPMFKYHIEKISKTTQTIFIPNGIDKEFLVKKEEYINSNKEVINVTYAGNIGDAQGIDLLFPLLLERLPEKYVFNIYGQGSKINNLQQNCTNLDAGRINIYPPVPREQLTSVYRDADILFLCLQPLSAFEKVIPSKIFEYGASSKPIVAALTGETARFVYEEIQGVIITGNTPDEIAAAIMQTEAKKLHDREMFRRKYSRDVLLLQMVKFIDSKTGSRDVSY